MRKPAYQRSAHHSHCANDTEGPGQGKARARDDVYSIPQSYVDDPLSTGRIVLDVMANDRGGRSKTLWAVTSGDENTLNARETADLKSRDAVGTLSTSELGAKVILNANGTLTYNFKCSAFKVNVADLALGEVVTDSFTYSIRMADGTLSFATVKIDFVGTNDHPVITSSIQTGTVVEDGVLSTKGQVTATDRDHGSVLKFTATGDDQGYGAFVIDARSGEWTFKLDNNAAQHLGAGEHRDLTFVVTVTDEHGAQVRQNVAIRVQGRADSTTLGGDFAGNVTEDGIQADSGVVSAGTGNSILPADPADLSGTYGDFTFNASTGTWAFALDNGAAQKLGEGDTATEALTIISSDGSSAVAVVTVHGTNDRPVATALDETVAEDAVVSGTVVATDADQDETATLTHALVGAAPAGLTFNSDGTYSFTAVSYDFVAGGAQQNVAAQFIATDVNGLASIPKSLTLTVVGTNDAASFGGDLVRDLTEDAAPSTAGTVTTSDPDAGQQGFLPAAAQDLSGAYGGFTFDHSTGSWTFTIDSAAAQRLGDGDTATEELTIAAVDGSTTIAMVTIHGVNDGPVAQAASVTVQEDAATSGTVIATDADASETATLTYALVGAAPAGLSFNSNGTYSFSATSYDQIALGAQQSLVIQFTASDEAGAVSPAQTLAITILGADDPTNFGGTLDGSVTEDGTLTTGGTVTISDLDAGQAGFATTGNLVTAHGSFTFDPGTGAWSYALNNAAVQSLTASDHPIDTLTLTAATGAQATIIVVVNGADEVVVQPPAGFGTTPPVHGGLDDPNDFDALLSTLAATTYAATITGASVANTSHGTNLAETINGQSGNDTLYGHDGNDVIRGGNDADLIYGQSGNDLLEGQIHADLIYGGSGGDVINGGAANDTLYGGSGNDLISGDDAGGTTHDMIVGGYGADTLSGAAGNDVFVYLSGRDTGDTILDWTSADTLSFAGLGVTGSSTASLSAHMIVYKAEAGGVRLQVDLDGDAASAELEIFLVGATIGALANTDIGAGDFTF